MRQLKPLNSMSLFYRLGCMITKYYRIILVGWGCLFLGCLLLSPAFFQHLTPPQLNVVGSQSELTSTIMERAFANKAGEQNFLVFHSNKWKVGDNKYNDTVKEVLNDIDSIGKVTVVSSPLENLMMSDVSQVSADLHTCYALLFMEGDNESKLQTIDALSGVLESHKNGIKLYLTGATPTIKDLTHMEKRDLTFAEKAGMPFVLIVLLVAFGSFTAAIIPLLLGGMAVIMTFGCLSISGYQNIDIIVPSIVTMIGLGIGIDYSLFLIMRYREELQKTDSNQAIAIAVASSGKSIFLSGVTVMISLIGLPIVRSQLFLNISIGTFAVIFILMLLTLTFLPALLCLLGDRINSLPIPSIKKKSNKTRSYLYGMTKHIMNYSFPYLLGAILVLLILSAPLLQIRLGIALNHEALKDYPTGKGNALLEENFVSGLYSPVLLVHKASGNQFSDEELRDIANVESSLMAYDEVQLVTSLMKLTEQMVGGDYYSEALELTKIPEFEPYTRFLINEECNVAPVMITLKHAPDSPEAKAFVAEISKRFESELNKGSLYIGGLTAQINDLHKETIQKTPLVILAVIGISFCFLVIAFKSLLIPIKAILLNVGCVSAACGMTVLIFQFGFGERLLEFTSLGYLQSYLPILTFAILFGLSMDYEVFLVGRIKEEWETTGDTKESIAKGIEYTGPFITQAALIMMIVFTSFILTRVLEIKQLGFTLALAILLDATIIRLVLVPVLLNMMGKWNWWLPSVLKRK